MITASEPSWIAPFSGLSPQQFGKLVTALRREGVAPTCKGRPWSLSLQDRVLLVTAYWRTNLTLRQLAPLFGVSKSAAARIVDRLGPLLALRQRERFRKETALIVDGTLIPTRAHTVAEQSKNYPYSTTIRSSSTPTPVSWSPSAGQFPATATPARLGNCPAPKQLSAVHCDSRWWLPRHRPDHPALILRDCRLKDAGIHHAMLRIARLHNLTLAG